MLVLGRNKGERIRITAPDGTHCWVSVERVGAGNVRIGFDFDSDYRIAREEIIDGGPEGADVMPSMPATIREDHSEESKEAA